LGTASLRESHPENGDKLEGVVEWEPVDGIDGALENSQERIDHPVSQPLSVIGAARSKERMERIVCWKTKANGVDQELGANVEEDEEKVQGSKAKHNVDLGDASLLFKVVHVLVFAQLLIESRDVILSTILDRLGRHDVGLRGSAKCVVIVEDKWRMGRRWMQRAAAVVE